MGRGKPDKYSDLFHSPDDDELYTWFDDDTDDIAGFGEIAPMLTIHKDSGEGLSNPRRMARLNGYYDATERGGQRDYLKDYSGVKFEVDTREKNKEKGRKGKTKDYTNVYLDAYRRALRNPEIYGEEYRDTGSNVGNLVSATRRTMIPNNFAGEPEKEGRDFTRDYVEAQNEYSGYSPEESSRLGFENTPVRRSNIFDEYQYVSGEKTAPGAVTYPFGWTWREKRPVVYVPAQQRLAVGRTGRLSHWQKGVLPHEFNHVAEDTGFSQGYDMDDRYGSAFQDLERRDSSYDDESLGYKWNEDPAELRSEIVAAMAMNGIDPKKRFADLDVDDQRKIVNYVARRMNLDVMNDVDLRLWDEILSDRENLFRDGGRMDRMRRLFGL